MNLPEATCRADELPGDWAICSGCSELLVTIMNSTSNMSAPGSGGGRIGKALSPGAIVNWEHEAVHAALGGVAEDHLAGGAFAIVPGHGLNAAEAAAGEISDAGTRTWSPGCSAGRRRIIFERPQ